ncbi:Positive regulator of sigma E, RseC/MucC [Oceanococcus atlanticus]|uniref:Positive regulator of sigma E, RseC/MucC n=1 Tax=Oceanococcus atlanticus TaxID=1317117 RepID=A0A1Y1SDA0_9GAMM|nr:SoxR reducing system RseC family protein [Oceanococcus atlanticus]ORE86976.1 Positive regulator of sigma E, RseC/MucC [Oceanococcus atlanticus]
MIENLAIVVERQGRRVRLAAASQTGCARCDAGEGCGGGVFGKLIRRRLQGLLLDDQGLNLETGQHVVLGIEPGIFVKATALIYLLPLLGLIGLAALLASLGANDAWIAGAGVSGLIAGAWLGPRLRRLYIDNQLQPRVLRRAAATDMRVCGSAPGPA